MEKNVPAPAAGVFGYLVGGVNLLNRYAVSLRCLKNMQIGNAHNMVRLENRAMFVWSAQRFRPMPHSCAGEPCYIVRCRWFNAFGRGCLHHNRPRPRAFGRGVSSLTRAAPIDGDRDRPLRIRRGRQSYKESQLESQRPAVFQEADLSATGSVCPQGSTGSVSLLKADT